MELLKVLIENSTKEDEVVLDPFAGSASTAVACVETGRNFVGFEIDETFYRKAEERLKEVQIKMIL